MPRSPHKRVSCKPKHNPTSPTSACSIEEAKVLCNESITKVVASGENVEHKCLCCGPVLAPIVHDPNFCVRSNCAQTPQTRCQVEEPRLNAYLEGGVAAPLCCLLLHPRGIHEV
eukprot:989087-Amphidinium_carterae.1